VPVIIVTAFEDKSYRYRALDAGATDFITSPVDAREFGTRLRNLLRLRRHQLDLQQRAAQMQEKLEKNTRLGKTNCAMALQCTDPGARCCRHHGAQYSFRYFAAMFALKHVRSYRTGPGARCQGHQLSLLFPSRRGKS